MQNTTHQRFVVIIATGIDADHHANQTFSVEVILEEMSYFGIAIRNDPDVSADLLVLTERLQTRSQRHQRIVYISGLPQALT
jgi:hypothetical protein